MAIPDIHFNHDGTDLQIAATITAGQQAPLTIKLHNAGGANATARVHLFWVGPISGNPNATVTILDQIGPPPLGFGNPVPLNVPAGKTASVTVTWTPNAHMFQGPLGSSVSGRVFAQATVDPVPPDFTAGDTSALASFNQSYKLCAAKAVAVKAVPVIIHL